MKQWTLPAPPQSSFEGSTSGRGNEDAVARQRGPGGSAGDGSFAASKGVAPLDAAFVRRSLFATLWLGALGAACVYAISASSFLALSFGLGAALSAVLLLSQVWFVRRVLAGRSQEPYRGWDKNLPMWLVVPLKYVLIGGAIAWMFEQSFFQPFAFGMGVLTVHIAIMARVAGRIAAFTRKPLAERYLQR
ncbi:MAG TPA: hypothetical protein VF600_18565 [Abditibacteriaceae bacterium]|jgi:hypothetical protein